MSWSVVESVDDLGRSFKVVALVSCSEKDLLFASSCTTSDFVKSGWTAVRPGVWTEACEADFGRPAVRLRKACRIVEDEDFRSGVLGGASPGDGGISLADKGSSGGYFAL